MLRRVHHAPPAPLPAAVVGRGEVAVVLRHGGRVGVGGVVAIDLDWNLAADAPRRDLGGISDDVLGIDKTHIELLVPRLREE